MNIKQENPPPLEHVGGSIATEMMDIDQPQKKQKQHNRKKYSDIETVEENQMRFAMELEFVQCLSNPHYLKFLAQQRYFQDKSFINYLKYLLYWKEPQYVKYIVYPHCLKFLELLQEENFRKALSNPGFGEFLHQQQFYHWQFYRNNRLNPNPPEASQPAQTQS